MCSTAAFPPVCSISSLPFSFSTLYGTLAVVDGKIWVGDLDTFMYR